MKPETLNTPCTRLDGAISVVGDDQFFQSFNHNGNPLRVIDQRGQPWFVAADVCASLGLDTRNLRRDLDADELQPLNLRGSGRAALIISESGLYSLIMRSRTAAAKTFKRWVTSVVLPSIRKNHGYMQGSERLSQDAQANLYALFQAQTKEALRRHDLATQNHHWRSPRVRDAWSEAAAQRIAQDMALPQKVVLTAASHGADKAVEALTRSVE